MLRVQGLTGVKKESTKQTGKSSVYQSLLKSIEEEDDLSLLEC